LLFVGPAAGSLRWRGTGDARLPGDRTPFRGLCWPPSPLARVGGRTRARPPFNGIAPRWSTSGPGVGFDGLQGYSRRLRQVASHPPAPRALPRGLPRGASPGSRLGALRGRGEARNDVAARGPSLLSSVAFGLARSRGVAAFEDHRLGGSHPLKDVRSPLLTLAPSFPTLPGPAARPSALRLRVRASSRGIVQRSPLRRLARQGVHSRWPPAGCPVARRLRDGNATSHPCSDLVVWCHLAGFLLPDGAPRVAAGLRPWGSPRFRLVTRVDRPSRALRARAPGLPRGAFLPFEAFPPCTAAKVRACALALRGRYVTAPTVTSRRVHRPPSPLAVATDPLVGSCLPARAPPTRPQGVPPCPGPLPTAPFPAWPARCSPGLG
jgi:hypothetical protein